MIRTIQTASEIRRHSVVDATYRIEGLCDRILIYEETALKDCLGLEFYEALLNDLNAIQSDVYDYDEEKNYIPNDYCIYEDVIYKCINNSVGSIPKNNSDWEIAPKFNNPVYQDLYDRYLKIYLANYAIHEDIVFSAIPATNKGLMESEKDSSGSKSVSLEKLYLWRRNAKRLSVDILELIKLFIKKNKDKFKMIAFLQECDGDCEIEEDSDRMAW